MDGRRASGAAYGIGQLDDAAQSVAMMSSRVVRKDLLPFVRNNCVASELRPQMMSDKA